MNSYLGFDDETKALLNKKSHFHDLVIDKSIIKTISKEIISQPWYHNKLKTLLNIYGKIKLQSKEHYF